MCCVQPMFVSSLFQGLPVTVELFFFPWLYLLLLIAALDAVQCSTDVLAARVSRAIQATLIRVGHVHINIYSV